eukprot:211803-Alexandrium_andersonii.AAC.1
MMRFRSFTSCKSDELLPRRPSISHMNFSSISFSTMSRSASKPVKVKSSPCAMHLTFNSAM